MTRIGMVVALSTSALFFLGCRAEPTKHTPTDYVTVPPSPDAKADAGSRDRDDRYTVSVPRRLAITYAEDRLAVSVDLVDLERVKLERAPDLEKTHGVKVTSAGGTGYHGPCETFDGSCFDVGESLLDPAAFPPGTTLKANLVLFETDIPPGHMWRPESKGYRELWTGTITGRVP